jgi:hypothetical protein
MDQHGPSKNVLWILDDPERTRAKQSAMLDIDIKHNDQWIATMRALVAEELPDDQFTVKRMAALKAWERGRKRAQVALHYAYDPRRRNPELVKREMKRQIAKVKADVDAYMQRRDGKAEPEANTTVSPIERATPLPKTTAAFQRPLEGINPTTVAMITADTGLDVAHATDEQIIEAYVSLVGVTAEQAQGYVDVLHPVG